MGPLDGHPADTTGGDDSQLTRGSLALRQRADSTSCPLPVLPPLDGPCLQGCGREMFQKSRPGRKESMLTNGHKCRRLQLLPSP